uniref:Reverse transcriptase zinc-binding domain-containing protein n=1 Tax=Cajanus cajan TaxID=3821 RepID=A0A151RJY5_CAJCA|nr:hypothetical protein KK1_035714 [Cajanus cajan]
MSAFNLDLFGKWHWRMLVEKNSLWVRIISSLYGVALHLPNGSGVKGSRWWVDLNRIEDGDLVSNEWLSSNCCKVIGNGVDTKFWLDKWVGHGILAHRFQIEINKNASIAEMFEWEGGVAKWKWSWRRRLLVWEQQLLNTLANFINRTKFIVSDEDKWSWIGAPERVYTVSSAYKILRNDIIFASNVIFQWIWTSIAPTKVSSFAWRVILNRIPTKDNLFYKTCSASITIGMWFV